MNLSSEQCTMQDRKLPSHTSHMNLTGAGEAVTEASRTEIRVTRCIMGHELSVMGPGGPGGGDTLSTTPFLWPCTVMEQPCTAEAQSKCECYPAPAVVPGCTCLHASQQQHVNKAAGKWDHYPRS